MIRASFFVVDAMLQDVKIVPISALVSLKLRKILGGQESTPSRVAQSLFRMPLIVGEIFVFLSDLVYSVVRSCS